MTGAHFDGYASNAAISLVVGGEKVTGRKADAVRAAYDAMQAAQRAIAKGSSNQDVTSVIERVC